MKSLAEEIKNTKLNGITMKVIPFFSVSLTDIVLFCILKVVVLVIVVLVVMVVIAVLYLRES